MSSEEGRALQDVPQQGEYIAVDDEQSETTDEGFHSGSDDVSSLTSLASEIRRGVVENGRLYASFGKSEYGLPRDEEEKDRVDALHERYYVLLGERRYLAPIGDNPKQILDLGASTGIWCMDIADEFPSAEVTGVDISPMQPTWVPPNCHFEIDDIEQPWTFKENHFDFIFARDLLLCIRDFPTLIKQCYDHIKPGGWIEFEGLDATLCCDDDSVPAVCGLRDFHRVLGDACKQYGTPMEDPRRYKEWFEAAGFETVVERRLKVPMNSWPKDPRLKIVGIFERENLLRGLEVMCSRIFQKGLGWSREEVVVLAAKTKNDIKNTKYHAYYNFHVVYGRKPLTANSAS